MSEGTPREMTGPVRERLDGEPATAASEGPDAVLAALDPEQRDVALASRGPVCVLAGAGTGKTRAVAHRIAYAVATGVARPDRVLAVTFTTRAAGELRGRLRQLGACVVPGCGLEQVQARTFHAAALRQLNHFWPTAVGGPAPAVIDSKAALVAEAAKRLRLRLDPAELRDVASEIEWAKVTQVRPDAYPIAREKAARDGSIPADRVAALYAGYEQLRSERHLIDFESVLELTGAILAASTDVATAIRDRYRYFVVDEYQDVNPLQKLLLDQWAGDRDDVCVVGDPRQTIYSFAGASPEYLTRFSLQYPHATVIRLIRNYRSSPQVVELANRVFRPSGQVLVSQRPAGPAPQLAEYPDERAEAADVARQAAELIGAGKPGREIAVLLRTNAMTAAYEEALAVAGVPYHVRGSERFFERAEVRQAANLIRVAARTAAADEDPVSAIRPVLTGLGLSKDPPAGRGKTRERWESLDALSALADGFFAASPQASLADFVTELKLRGSIGQAPDTRGITLASLHAAKGLEWDVVFLPCLTDGSVPIVYAQSAEAIEEERRLLYVGITRARQLVFLSWALARTPGEQRSRAPSRFLRDLQTPAGRAARPAVRTSRSRQRQRERADREGMPG